MKIDIVMQMKEFFWVWSTPNQMLQPHNILGTLIPESNQKSWYQLLGKAKIEKTKEHNHNTKT
jgi:hypothetical protein